MDVAANPWYPNQIAVGMSDGAIHVLEPLLEDWLTDAVTWSAVPTLFSWLWLVTSADLLWKKNTDDWLVPGGWCWFDVSEKHGWLIATEQSKNIWLQLFSYIYKK